MTPEDVTQADLAAGQDHEAETPASAVEPAVEPTPPVEIVTDVATANAAAQPTPDATVIGPVPESEQTGAGEPTPDPEQHTAAPTRAPAQDSAKPSSAGATPPARQGNTFLPMVLGGIIAGAIGFGVARLEVFDSGDLDTANTGVMTELQTQLDAQAERIETLETAPADPVPADPAPAEMPTVDLSPIEAQLEELQTRIAALEERPASVVPEGVDAQAYAAELEELKSSVDNQRSEIEALLSNARTVEQATADAARTANAQTAITRIVSALDTGQPFADALADLEALDVGEPDPALSAVAGDGVVTLNVLQSQFPDAARQALAAARASGAADGQQGLGGFFTRALGARSVTPREGDDPDAVLSRAEAAVNSGDLPTALNELDTLPEEAQAAITEWRAAADARVDARAAADALAQRLTAD